MYKANWMPKQVIYFPYLFKVISFLKRPYGPAASYLIEIRKMLSNNTNNEENKTKKKKN